jgi:UDP-N-acetylglucosamine 2-epimerase
LQALEASNRPVLLQWPNADAGSDAIQKAIRQFRNFHPSFPLRTIPNLAPDRFLRLLAQCSVLVGNSSSGIREASFLGVPVVNIGQRQAGRERAQNVIDVDYSEEEIRQAIGRQLEHGKYPSSRLYGDGTAGSRIASKLLELA